MPGPVTLSPAATDDVDPSPAVEINIDGAGWFAAPASVELATDGDHTVSVRATDDTGHVSEIVTTRVKIDATKPQVAASSDGAAHTVSLNATDATSGVSKIEYALATADLTDPASWTVYTGPIAAGRDAKSFAYRATDNAGNMSAVAVFDYAPTVSVPSVALTAAPAKAVFGKSVILTATVPADAVGKIEFRDGSKSLGTVSVSNGSASKSVKLTAGTHIITARFSGDTVYENATSMQVPVQITKAVPASAKVTSTTFKVGTKPTLKASIGKLSNGNWPVGKVTYYVNGKSIGADAMRSVDHGQSFFTVTKKYSSSIKVKVKFIASDSGNISSKTSSTVTVKAKK